MAFNKAVLMGRITHEPELKVTQSGINVCSFSIAVDRRFQTKGEEKKTDFFNIVAWRQQAEFVTKWFHKGNMVLVEGELQTRSYTDKNGQNVRVVELVADQICFTGEKTGNGGGGGYSAPPLPDEPPAGYGGGYGSEGGYSSAPAASEAPSSGSTPAPSADFSSAESDDYPF